MGSRFETYVRPDRGFAAWATNDDLTLVVGGWPFAEFEANKKDVEGNFLKMLELAPPFAERIRAAHREARFVGTAVPNFFRKPFGPGWALVGDAGYNKDFITAQGITDAFRDAELCATALDETFSGLCSFESALGPLPTHSRPARAADVRVHHPARNAGAPATRAGAVAAGGARQHRSDGRLRAGQRRSNLPAKFFSPQNADHIFTAAA